MTLRDSAPNVARVASKRPTAGSRMREHPENGPNRAQASKRRERFRLFEAPKPIEPQSRSLTAPATH